jgi:hypothetical protein
MRPTMATAMAAMLAAVSLGAADRWEYGANDDGPHTRNELRHGMVQVGHDFDWSDEDWAAVVVQARRSYEARAGGGTALWWRNPCVTCAWMYRGTANATMLTIASADSGTAGSTVYGTSASARWTATADTQEYIVLNGPGQTDMTYDLEFYDTSYLIPRFNNSGTQATVLLVQNGSRFAVAAEVHFYNGAGTHLHSQPLSLPLGGNAVLNTATIPALQNVSGTAVLTHDAPYGTLAGKAVSLEPATGLAFDTPMQAVPR